MEIIRQRQRVVEVQYFLVYEDVNVPRAGFHFPCDENGIRLSEERNAVADANYEICVYSEEGLVKFKGVQECASSFIRPAIGLCTCGEDVFLDSQENQCECGLLYSVLGQGLRPRPIDECGRHIPYEDEGLDYDRETDDWQRAIAGMVSA